MKQLLLFCAALLLGVVVQAQNTRVNTNKPVFDTNNKTVSFIMPVKMKVSLSGDKMYIVYDQKEIPDAGIQVLDSLIRSVPDSVKLNVEFQGVNAVDAKKQAIEAVLKKCQCPVSRNMISMRMQ
jgi:hypothetical protein